MNKCKCDHCSYEFNPKLKEKSYGIDIKEAYFLCPECKFHYNAYFTNAEIRKEQRIVKKMRKHIPAMKVHETEEEYKVIVDNLHVEITQKMNKIRRLMDDLKEEMLGR